MPDYVRVASANDLPDGSCLRVEVEGRPITVFNVDGEYFAVDDTCTHAEASLAEGELINEEIVCPLHFATFNIRTGECTGPPASEDLATYPVRLSGEGVEIEI
ncbi:MAG: non-heme iron oxygenase ferredoxin subunit [Planctomycetota bacterium]|jgi:3-phenylpropionate/trans-cinnamate dioxygenase ferredoxin subunit